MYVRYCLYPVYLYCTNSSFITLESVQLRSYHIHFIPAIDSISLMSENDVLYGCGNNSALGNCQCRALVGDFQPIFLHAPCDEKSKTQLVVLIVRNCGGQFLYRDNTNGWIYEVGDKNAEAKTRECFRNTIYYHTHKDDTDFIEKRLEYKRNYYHAHKYDLEFKARTAKSRAKYHI